MQVPGADGSLEQWLSYLEQLHPKTIDLSLERIKPVADRLGLNDWPALKIVVGGTNGKGSTCAMLESIYYAAGYKTGLYTSPHLLHFNERIRINGEFASDQAIVSKLNHIEQIRGDYSLSYFEFTTLAAFLLFKEANLDVCVLEVGLGGRLDVVNIVDADCAIVTSVDIDHIEYLGNSRDSIGLEKASIFRSGKPAICGDPEPPQSLLDYAAQIGADLWLFGRDFNYDGDKQQWAFAGRQVRRNALAYPALRGANQLLNASAALAAIESLNQRLAVPIQSIRQGLLQVSIPGRFQILPGQPTCVLDVAHNPHAAAVLAHNLRNMSYFPYTYAVIGMLSDKDASAVIGHFKGIVDHWICADLDGSRGRPGAQLADIIRTHFPPDSEGLPTVQLAPSPAEGFKKAHEMAGESDRIIVFGSFMTVAGVLQHLGQH